MSVANATHVPRFEILLALFADCQATVWKLNIQRLLESRWRERKDILGWPNGEILWTKRAVQCWIPIPMNLPREIVPVETSFADAS